MCGTHPSHCERPVSYKITSCCLAVKVRGLALVKGLEEIVTRPAERICGRRPRPPVLDNSYVGPPLWIVPNTRIKLSHLSLSLSPNKALSLSLSLSLSCTRGSGDRIGIPNPRKSGPVIGADRQRSGPSCVLLKRVPQGRTESGGIVLAAHAGPRVPSGGVTQKRRHLFDCQ